MTGCKHCEFPVYTLNVSITGEPTFTYHFDTIATACNCEMCCKCECHDNLECEGCEDCKE